MHQSGSVSLCRSAISVLVATALYSPIALASTVEYGETVDGVVLEKDIQLELLSMVRQLMVLSWKKISSWFMGPPIIRKSILAENSIYKNLV
ncbi:hypothetical protein DNQ77_03540 [Escherichia coli]|nr:hypothetical protein [Escherichia coli]